MRPLPSTLTSIRTSTRHPVCRSTTATGILQVKGRSGQVADATNFCFDLNASGSITASGILVVKGRSGQVLPPALVGGRIEPLRESAASLMHCPLCTGGAQTAYPVPVHPGRRRSRIHLRILCGDDIHRGVSSLIAGARFALGPICV